MEKKIRNNGLSQGLGEILNNKIADEGFYGTPIGFEPYVNWEMSFEMVDGKKISYPYISQDDLDNDLDTVVTILKALGCQH
jgi:hypothetical protein